MIIDRVRREELRNKIMTADEAAMFIKDGMIMATSGFTPSGYPKAVPLALAKRAENGEKLNLTIITGASVGDELDGALSRTGVMVRRYPYQTNKSSRDAINAGKIMYQDMHLSHVAQFINYGFLGKINVAVIEALAITEEGGIIPTTSVGISPQAVKNADIVIVEINTTQPMELEGMHDIYITENPPQRKPIPIINPGDRIGTPYIPCDPQKIVAIVECDIKDNVRPLGAIDEDSKKISGHIIEFLEHEVKMGRLPKNLLPLQSGVGSVANAVLGGLTESKFENLTCYTEVIQDSMLDLIDAGKVTVASGCSLTPSEEGLKRLHENMKHYAKYCILRPLEISNHPEVARRLGVIAMNTAIEFDIYGHVNSTNIMGSRMMNGLGGSGDFTRNAYLSIFTTVSTAKGGDISSVVPMVSHVDHTEHDVSIVVTEQGLADLRNTSPTERAKRIIEKCVHPDYKPMLKDYFERASKGKFKHEPHIINEALSFHGRFMETGTMKIK
ncbi:acetyl-CoA hydrolase/transferase family protein [Paramaledivibacter caminithermalis]|jgi:succinyl-CoA:acetate CoA-transferase|uniref:Succinyl-CoA:acetate CoA-transferase n=1 Tax=Paramaledivibacter caminithermalis (strain DSM 15212 / CIP 107654 / DViRD3) TaxID=1121301 RepID=A0A1M6N0S6_PARC5|nr:acetyl-CoA hydrolase/transferase family protein [Paramaledivibacter caminithermalis]SHJ89216.1 succinyl-CoA:acetate CoA-transferase [Paramaledivibacter caminithermalis DSM 15212]